MPGSKGIVRSLRDPVLSAYGDANWDKLANVMGHEGSAAIEFMLSPGEMTGAYRLPDGLLPSSGVYMKKMDGLTFTSPWDAETSATWNLTLITIPSLDTPLIALFSRAGTPEIPWDAISTIGADPTTFPNGATLTPWSDATAVDILPLGRNLPGLRAPDGINPSTIRLEGTLGYVDLTKANWFQVFTTDTFTVVTDFRCTGMSITSELDAAALIDQGTVYSWRLPRATKWRPIDAEAPLIVGTTEDPPVLNVDVGSISSPSYVIAGQPYSVAAASTLNHYTGPAKKGCYVTSHPQKPSEFKSMSSDRGCLAIETSGSIQANAYSEEFQLTSVRRNISYGASNVVTTSVPLTTVIDDAMSITVTTYIGLDPKAIVRAKVVAGFEFVAAQTGNLANFMGPTPPRSSAFAELMPAIVCQSGPGYPATANWLSTLISSIGPAIMGIVRATAPVWLPWLTQKFAPAPTTQRVVRV